MKGMTLGQDRKQGELPDDTGSLPPGRRMEGASEQLGICSGQPLSSRNPIIRSVMSTGLRLPVAEWVSKLFFAKGSRPTKKSFEDLPQALFWLRSFLAVVLGISCGLLSLTGWSGFVLFGSIEVGLFFFLLGPMHLDVDYEDFNQQELLGEGLMPSFAIFLLLWSTLFTGLYAQ